MVFVLLAAGLGLRQTGRVTLLNRDTVERKFRKIGKHMRGLNHNLRRPIDKPRLCLLMDEFESYEGRRNTRPVTIPMLIDYDSDYILHAVSAPIRPRGTMTEARKRAIRKEEKLSGVRRDGSRAAISRVLRLTADACKHVTSIEFRTDEKSSYPGLIAKCSG